MHRHGFREWRAARIGLEYRAGLVGFAKGNGGELLRALGVNALTVVSGEVRRDALGVELLDESSAQVLQRLATYEVDVPTAGCWNWRGRIGRR